MIFILMLVKTVPYYLEERDKELVLNIALYNSKKILLLDRSTSSVDNETERNILLDLSKLKNEITVFLIKHDERNLDLFDRVLKIKNKQIQIKND